MNGERDPVRATFRRVLAATCACDADDFCSERVVVTNAREIPGRLRYPPRDVLIVTTGQGAVVSCNTRCEEWVRARLANLSRDELFSAQAIAQLVTYLEPLGLALSGPKTTYSCARGDLRKAPEPEAVTMRSFRGTEVADLYRYTGFDNALSYEIETPRPDVLAVAAFRGNVPVGVAAASEDSDELWQIGVDVMTGERSAGLGRALVGIVTRAVFEEERLPFYAARVANIHSQALALGLGYLPAWTDMYSKPIA